jgi:hypothetical protein
MTKDFIRCYIGNISYDNMRLVMQEVGGYEDWKLTPKSDFREKKSLILRYGNTRDKLLFRSLLDCSTIIIETDRPESTKSSLICKDGLLLDDLLTLLSIAQFRYIPALVVERMIYAYNYEFEVYLYNTLDTKNTLPISKTGQFISTAINMVSKDPSWLGSSGFQTGIHWYTLACKTLGIMPTVLNVALYWIGLEVVASKFLQKNTIHVRGKEHTVRRFARERGYTGEKWRFLSKAIRDWYEIRNKAFHEGQELGLSSEMIMARGKQINDFLSLVLIEMVQEQDCEWKEQVAAYIASYVTDIPGRQAARQCS